jgi:large subunit ribosomal protein L10
MPTKAPADSAQMQRKSAVIDDIKARLASADAAVLTEYRGLTVSDIATLRAALRSAATDYKIFKNTLARRAARDAGLDDIIGSLEGPVAIAFVRRDGGDAVTAAKALRDQLLARLAGGFQAPMVKAAGLFQAFTRNMAYGVKALIDQRVAGGEALPENDAAAPEATEPSEIEDPAPATENPAPGTENDKQVAEATEPAQASEKEE